VRVLIDTNVLLDFLLQRELFFQDAERLFQAIDSGQIVGYVTATTAILILMLEADFSTPTKNVITLIMTE
jgi:predicted nucleic acid-binding protein